MIGWLAVIVLTGSLAVLLGLIVRTSIGPLSDVEKRCGEIDDDLDVMYGGH